MSQSRGYHQTRSSNLSRTAKETKEVLPEILKCLPNLNIAESSLISLSQVRLTGKCPGYTTSIESEAKDTSTAPTTVPGTHIRVIDGDTLNVAIELSRSPLREPQNPNPRVAVLNLASDKHPGGGWVKGALAQEEAICYRSSLYRSLSRRYYPLPARSAIYSPSVLIIRSAFPEHDLLFPEVPAKDLPIVSIISVAALRNPKTAKIQSVVDGEISEREVFAEQVDRDLTKDKMRLSLRVAAAEKHTKLVLGALGCGAFRNPNTEVALCWQEVLREPEFTGGWWEDVVFAVLDKGNDGDNGAMDDNGNFATFHKVLNGLIV